MTYTAPQFMKYWTVKRWHIQTHT